MASTETRWCRLCDEWRTHRNEIIGEAGSTGPMTESTGQYRVIYCLRCGTADQRIELSPMQGHYERPT